MAFGFQRDVDLFANRKRLYAWLENITWLNLGEVESGFGCKGFVGKVEYLDRVFPLLFEQIVAVFKPNDRVVDALPKSSWKRPGLADQRDTEHQK